MADFPSRLTKNSLWMIVSRLAAQGLALVFIVLLARRLGTAEFGAYAFITAILFVANALTTFGTDMYLIREIAGNHDLSGLPAALTVQLGLSSIFIVLVWSFSRWIPNQSQETLTALKVYSLALIPLAFFTVFTTALRAKERMDLYALLNMMISFLQVGAVLTLRESNLIVLSSFLLCVQVLAALAAGALCSFALPGFWRSWSSSSFRPFDLVKAAAPIAVLTLLAMFYQRLGVLMLSLITSPVDTGIFSTAARLVEGSKTGHLAVFAALYPAMASRLPSPAQRDNLFTETYLKLLVVGAVLISFLLSAFATPLVKLLFGHEFISSRSVVEILSWTLIPFTINTYLTLFLVASKQEQIIGRALLSGLLALLVLNFWWIPAGGPEGAAWALLSAECLQTLILMASAPSRIPVKRGSNELSNLP
jgi:O-antigen/teichoic acid export membrane protein